MDKGEWRRTNALFFLPFCHVINCEATDEDIDAQAPNAPVLLAWLFALCEHKGRSVWSLEYPPNTILRV